MISVVMSVYNEEIEWLEQAVNSILEQTYTDFEFIIICDNPEIKSEIRGYLLQQEKNNSKIKILWNRKNVGLADSLNRGIECASGDFVARMDADDISDKERLERELHFLTENNYDLVSANKINIDEKGDVISVDNEIVKDPNKVLMYGNTIIHSSVLVKKSVLSALGGYRKLANSEDWDLWLRMVEHGYTIGILNEPLLLYRIRSNSASIGRQLQQFYVSQYIIRLHEERQKYGKDTFSVKNMNEYLRKKKITKQKQKRFSKAYEHIQRALEKRQEKKWLLCVTELVKAGIIFPALAYRDINCFIRSRGALKNYCKE